MAALPYLEQVEYRWIEDENGCWIWQRATNGQGYGLVGGAYTRRLAHRAIYEQERGPIGDLHLHHECGVTLCVNPDHLRTVTPSEHASLRGPTNRKRRVSDKQLFYLRQLLDGPLRTAELRKGESRVQNALQVSLANEWVTYAPELGRRGGSWTLTELGREATLKALETRDA